MPTCDSLFLNKEQPALVCVNENLYYDKLDLDRSGTRDNFSYNFTPTFSSNADDSDDKILVYRNLNTQEDDDLLVKASVKVPGGYKMRFILGLNIQSSIWNTSLNELNEYIPYWDWPANQDSIYDTLRRPTALNPLGYYGVRGNKIADAYKNNIPQTDISYYFCEIDAATNSFSIGTVSGTSTQYLSTVKFRSYPIFNKYHIIANINFTVFDKNDGSLDIMASISGYYDIKDNNDKPTLSANGDALTITNNLRTFRNQNVLSSRGSFGILHNLDSYVEAQSTIRGTSKLSYSLISNLIVKKRSLDDPFKHCKADIKKTTLGLTVDASYGVTPEYIQSVLDKVNLVFRNDLNLEFELGAVLQLSTGTPSGSNLFDSIQTTDDFNIFISNKGPNAACCCSSQTAIGCARISDNELCRDGGWVLFYGNPDYDAGLLAHELGHLLGANHQDGPRWIMSTTNSGSIFDRATRAFQQFHPVSINTINNIVNNVCSGRFSTVPGISPYDTDIPELPQDLEDVGDIIFTKNLPDEIFLYEDQTINLNVDATPLNLDGLPVNRRTDALLGRECKSVDGNCYTWEIRRSPPYIGPINNPETYTDDLTNATWQTIERSSSDSPKLLTIPFTIYWPDRLIEIRCKISLRGFEKYSNVCKVYKKPSKAFITTPRRLYSAFTGVGVKEILEVGQTITINDDTFPPYIRDNIHSIILDRSRSTSNFAPLWYHPILNFHAGYRYAAWSTSSYTRNPYWTYELGRVFPGFNRAEASSMRKPYSYNNYTITESDYKYAFITIVPFFRSYKHPITGYTVGPSVWPISFDLLAELNDGQSEQPLLLEDYLSVREFPLYDVDTDYLVEIQKQDQIITVNKRLSINIQNIQNLNNIESISEVDTTNLRRWTPDPSIPNNLNTLEFDKTYKIRTKFGVSFPYNLYYDASE